MWTVLALIIMVFMGGIIAYNGDLIGRKYGKRRVTLFNLRPKHTAILITSVTGGLISLFTVTSVFLLVPRVREVIMHGEDAIRALPVLDKQASMLKGSVALLERQQKETGRQLDEDKRRLAQTDTDLKAEQRKFRVVEKKLQLEQHRLQVAQAETLQVKKDNKQEKDLNTRLSAINKSLAENQTKLARSNSDLEAKNAQLLVEYRKKQEENRQIGNENQEIAKQNLELSKENASLNMDHQKAIQILGRFKDESDRLATLNADLDKKNKLLLASNSELVAAGKGYLVDWKELQRRFEAMRIKRIAIHGGEDLSRNVVPAMLPEKEVRGYIEKLMSDANQVAQSKGARPNEQSPSRAVQIVDKQFLTETPFGGIRPVTVSEQDRINAVVHKLTMSASPVCVLALAVANSPEGEPAAIDFQPFNDWLVYPKGRPIGARKLDASEKPEKIYVDLMAFLKDVGQTAIEKGMIPRIDPATGNPEVGSLNWPELVRLVEKVRGHQGSVRVTALALDDTKASDPLKLDFKIEASL